MNFKIIAFFALSSLNFIINTTAKQLPSQPKTVHPKIVPKIEHPKNPVQQTTIKPTPLVAPIHPQPTMVINNIPFGPELQTAKITPAIIQGWQALYHAFENAQNNQPITMTPQLTELFNTNFYSMMATVSKSTTFPQFNNDPQGTLHFNYVTKHLHDTAKRIQSIVQIHNNNNNAVIQSAATCRDLGIIVNWYNNTDAQFSINQTDGKTSTQIGMLEPGLNGLNLHLAALQEPAPATNTGKSITSSTTQYFSLIEQNAENPIQIFIKMMTGTELIAFLRTLYRDPKAIKDDTFEMNGLPTSPEYITEPTDNYLVLIQNPTPATAAKRDPNQRIQAIDITKFAQPYLLTMQINAEEIDPTPPKDHHEQSSSDNKILVYQPSITVAQLMMNATIKPINFPIMILPDFADKNSKLHALWMLATTTTLAVHTNFKLFGKDSFANAFEYFNNLSCFNNQNRYTFCIDLYNTLPIGTSPHDASWLLGACIFEASLFADFAQIHTSQDSYNNIVCNDKDCFYLNFQLIAFNAQENNAPILHFQKEGFNATYNYSLNTTSSINTLPITDAKEDVFVDITKINNTKYFITYSSKNNVLLSTKTIFGNMPISDIKFHFLRESSHWMGSQTITLQDIPLNEFKITYEAITSENLYKLAATKSSSIDKKNIIHTVYLNHNQINNLYLKLYKIFKNADFTYCSIIDPSNIPPFLLNLTINDWHNGIYCIFDVHNANSLSSQHPGKLITTFYKNDHSFIGRIITQGSYQNNINNPGIQSPVIYYDLYSNAFNPLYNIYLSTGMLLKQKNS